MRRSSLLVVSILFALVSPGFAQVVPGSREIVRVDWDPPPRTLEGLWDRADLVVRARVIALGPPFLNQFKSVERIHQLQVLEVLKAPGTFGGVFRLREYGGTVNANGVEISTPYPGDILPQPGDEALYFLCKGEQDGVYRTAFGPAGLYEIRRSRDPSQPIGREEIQISHAAQAIGDLRGTKVLGLDEFLQKLRTFRGFRVKR